MRKKLYRDHEAFPVLVLAAGASRRLGRPKAMLPIGNGIMLDRAIDQARHLGTRITVVTGGGYPLIRFRCQRSVSAWHYASHWEEGMAASLRSGIESLRPRARGVFIVLLDQPLITGDDLAHLARAARKAPGVPVAADIHGRPAAPAYIPRYLWPEVLQLEGDRGAAGVLARHGAITLPVAGAVSDVDTPDDWRRLAVRYQNQFR
ncbi:nucleotidyltransferase family protein [Marinobacter sp.]|uniref:nucleotidyltransferase family protein n=1 Tax=Marinobacter sp. TaxID=50741 RepID=UPI002B4829B8|nr:nucleotidyltransferase family protein [Marinobacter sp.]HKK55513.1 nucleotidyltransferase family protein [Marinobacter sp.]